MYTNSFIKEQMAQSQSCDREEIGLNLQVASEGIQKANCSDFNDLQAALNDLSKLLLREDDVASQTASADSSSESASQNTASAPQNVNAPQNASTVNAAVPVPEFKKEKSEQKVKSSDPNSNVHWNYARLMREIDKVLNSTKSSDDMKTKYRNLKPQFENATKFEEVEKLVNVNNVKFYANSIYSGGTRKRRMRRVKTQRRRKNARTIKKKITNNKSGKRN
jgi:hypothetical protein